MAAPAWPIASAQCPQQPLTRPSFDKRADGDAADDQHHGADQRQRDRLAQHEGALPVPTTGVASRPSEVVMAGRLRLTMAIAQ